MMRVSAMLSTEDSMMRVSAMLSMESMASNAKKVDIKPTDTQKPRRRSAAES
jgi:hypothetical protein